MVPFDVAELAAIAASGVRPLPGDFAVAETPGGRVLFTAPHAVCHFDADTSGTVKGADVGTGDLAVKLAVASGGRALVTQAPWPGNANADPVSVCVLKQRVLRLLDDGAVTAVIDLHGMSERHGLDVCVGSGGTDTGLATAVAAVFVAHGFTTSVDAPFRGDRPGTVTRTVVAQGFPAVQLELSPEVRRTCPAAFVAAITAVLDVVAPGR